MEDVKTAALTDCNLTKCRSVMSVQQSKISDEENILEDVVFIKMEIEEDISIENVEKDLLSNEYCSLSVEEYKNNFDKLLNIKTEENIHECAEEDELGNVNLYSTDSDNKYTTRMKMPLENINVRDQENNNSRFYPSVSSWNKELIPNGQINQNYDRNEMSNRTQDVKSYKDGRLIKGISKLIKRKSNSSLHSKENGKCDYCELKFNSKQVLQRHIKVVHLKLKPSSGSSSLNRHSKPVHMKLKPLKCKHCDYTCSRSSNLKLHTNSVHLKFKPFICEYCDYTCSRSSHLKLHTNSVHLKFKPFKCEHCDYTSSESGSINRHTIAVHLKLKHFKCEHCDYTSSRSVSINRHTKAVHLKLKPFKCEHCDYTCSRSTNLKRHITRNHNWDIERNIDAKEIIIIEKLFKCELCEFSSLIYKNVLCHISEIHKESETFKCTDCKLNFVNRNEYLSHKERKPFMCVDCNSRFCSKENLIDHMEFCPNVVYYTNQ